MHHQQQQQQQQQQVGLLRVIDAVQTDSNTEGAGNVTHDPQRSIEFAEADYASISARDVMDTALAALHKDKPLRCVQSGTGTGTGTGEWVVAPALCGNDGGGGGGGSGDGGFILPGKASLLSSGLRPNAGVASEVYLTGKWRWFVPSGHQRDVVVATVDAAASTSAFSPGSGGDETIVSSMGFVPSVVQVVLWSVPEKPVYEIDVRRPLNSLTCGKLKKIVSKFSGIAVGDMDVDVDNITVRDDKIKLFPFLFDPAAVPTVRIRTRNEQMATSVATAVASPAKGSAASMNVSVLNQTPYSVYDRDGVPQHATRIADSFGSSPRSRARVEAEYGMTFPVVAADGSATENASGVHYSPMPQQLSKNDGRTSPRGGGAGAGASNAALLQQVPPEHARDWSTWLEQRRAARDAHVRVQLVPSSKDQIEIERALQVKTADDVRAVVKNASQDLASSAQLLHQQLESVREEILRERLGDRAFAQSEGARAVTTAGPVLTSAVTDGVNREPLVVSFR